MKSTLYTHRLRKYVGAAIIFWVITLFLTSCSKQEDEINTGITGTKIAFKVGGLVDGTVVSPAVSGKLASSNLSSEMSAQAPSSKIHTEQHTKPGFGIDVTTIQAPISESTGQRMALSKVEMPSLKSSSSASMAGATKLMASSGPTPMGKDTTYVLLIYRNNEPGVWKSFKGKARQAIELDVIKGDTYKWFAYSYNDKDDILLPADMENPKVEAPTNKDLLYASGVVEVPRTSPGTPFFQQVDILFKHKMAQVKVVIDGRPLARHATITSITAEFAQPIDIYGGVLDIKGGNMTVSTTKESIKDIFNGADSDNFWEAIYYTADPNNLTSYDVKITQLPVVFDIVDPSIASVNLATFTNNTFPTPPNLVKHHVFDMPKIGQSLFAETVLSYTFQSKRILHMSSNYAYAYAMERSHPWKMLNDQRNFGPLPESLVRMQPSVDGSVWRGAAADAIDNKANNWIVGPGSISDLDLNQKKIVSMLNERDPYKSVDILISGSDMYFFSPSVIQAIKDFVNDGGVYMMMYEAAGNLPTTSGKQLIAAIMDEDISSFNMVNMHAAAAGSVFPMVSTVNDLFTNGPFGDVRNQQWGEDAAGLMGVTGLPSSKTTIYSYGQAMNRIDNPSFAAAATMFRHKTKNFFFLGDGGLSSWNGGADLTICPFLLDVATARPVPKAYGNAYLPKNYAAGSKKVYNSVLTGNLLLWAAGLTEFNGRSTWRYGPNN